MKQNLPLSFASIVCWFLLVIPCQAQLRIAPLTQTPPHAATSQASARTQAVTLPFFDDFSTYYGQPDPALWINGGTVVNNTFADDPPSKGFATFDGLRFNGSPYSAITTINTAATDTLTSQPINLGGLTPSSNVLLSFWWATQNLGEFPDASDSLVLQFKDNNDNWITKWQRIGDTTYAFQDTLLQVNEARFLHDNFQFRFIAYGRPSGLYDIWNLDYVILSRDAKYDDGKYIRDVAVTIQPKSALKRYSSMPLDQFLVNPSSELRLIDTTKAYNQHNGFNFLPYTYELRNSQTNQQLFYYDSKTDPDPANQSPQINGRTAESIKVTTRTDLTVVGTSPLFLQSKFQIGTNIQEVIIPGVDLGRNDTIGRATILSDYYAYDDGTAEYGIGIRQRQGSVAVRYILNKPDTLTAVNILFVHTTDRDLSGQTFVLKIWKKLDGQRSSVLYEKAFAIEYPNQLNKFFTYSLQVPADTDPAPIAVSDTIYVGWTQSSNDLLAVGYDRNSDSRSQQFYDISGGSQWQPNTEPKAGSIMIRPVFGSGVVTGIEPNAPPAVVASFRTFPNPNQGILYWNQEGVRRIKVQDILGRTLKEQELAPNAAKQINVGELPNGMYLFTFQLNQYRIVRKIIISR
jgi:hypothetical protein